MEIAMVVKVTAEARITLPKAVREAAGIRPGDRVSARAGGGWRHHREHRAEWCERSGIFTWTRGYEPQKAVRGVHDGRGHGDDPKRALTAVDGRGIGRRPDQIQRT